MFLLLLLLLLHALGQRQVVAGVGVVGVEAERGFGMFHGLVGVPLHQGTQRGIVMGLRTEVVVFGLGQRTLKSRRRRFGIA